MWRQIERDVSSEKTSCTYASQVPPNDSPGSPSPPKNKKGFRSILPLLASFSQLFEGRFLQRENRSLVVCRSILEVLGLESEGG